MSIWTTNYLKAVTDGVLPEMQELTKWLETNIPAGDQHISEYICPGYGYVTICPGYVTYLPWLCNLSVTYLSWLCNLSPPQASFMGTSGLIM